jgi:hypothetical protein
VKDQALEVSGISDRIRRRTLLKGGLLVGGSIVAGIASPIFTRAAEAATVDQMLTAPSGDTYTFQAQTGWSVCRNCQSVYYDDAQGPSGTQCPANLANHIAQDSNDYRVPYGNTGIPDVQSPWRWCGWCNMLFYGPGQPASLCMNSAGLPPPGGPHSSGTWSYNLPYDPSSGGIWHGGSFLTKFNWCKNCQSLFWSPNQPISRCTYNPGVANHQPGGSHNYLLFVGF